MHGWLSLLPFLIVIPIAIWTKQVIPGLFTGLVVGSYLKAQIKPSIMMTDIRLLPPLAKWVRRLVIGNF